MRGAIGTTLGDAAGPALSDEIVVVLDVELCPALGEALDAIPGDALSLGDEMGSSLGDFSLPEVGERLGLELGEVLSAALSLGSELGAFSPSDIDEYTRAS